MRRALTSVLTAAAVTSVGCGANTAHAQDFFSQLFGGFARRVERPFIRMPFATESPDDGYGRRRIDDETPRLGGGGQAYCVRTCDGRYFPLSGVGNQSKAASCSALCPSSETQIYYGSQIDNAASEIGKRYGDLPNAFKYRTELVAGCTCNGNPTGLAPVNVEDDPTLRRGDIVAGADGLLVTRGKENRGASLEFSPATEAIRLQFSRPRGGEAD